MIFIKQHVTILLLLLNTSIYSQTMKAHFIDIDQADATLLEFECGVVMIDAGSQVFTNSKQSTQKLINYLDAFFERRTDLNKTINTILITHNHFDHNESLNEISDKYKVLNVVSTENYNTNDVQYLIDNEEGIEYRYLTYTDALSKKPNGMYYEQIDPFDCDDNGPVIKVFTGMVEIDEPVEVNGHKFYKSHFSNPNNHSLVIKVEYGESSFLFTGDLEEEGIEYLLANYHGNEEIFDVDVYQVGHHGSSNATTQDLLNVIKPKYAVISAGFSGDRGQGTGWDHGHPNKGVVKMLNEWDSMIKNNSSKKVLVFDGQETEPVQYEVSSSLYCTCWENNVILKADVQGNIEVGNWP